MERQSWRHLIHPNLSTPTASKFVFQEETPPFTIGSVGRCSGHPLKDEMVGIVLDETTQPLYESTRYGCCPYDIPGSRNGWQRREEI